MILSPEKRKIPTNKSLKNVLSDPGVCGLPVVKPARASTATTTTTQINENIIVPPMNRGPLPTLSTLASSSHDPEQLSKNTAELASHTVNEWSSILRNIPHSPPELSVSSTRMKRREKEKDVVMISGSSLDQDRMLELEESKSDVRRVSRKRTRIKSGTGEEIEEEEKDKSTSSPYSHPPNSTEIAVGISPSSTLEIIPISLQDSISDKCQSPLDAPYPPRQASEVGHHHLQGEDSSEDDGEEEEDYGSGYDEESVQRLSSASNWSLSPEPKHLPSLRHKASDSSQPSSGPPLHSSYSMSKSSYSMHQSMYQSLHGSHSSSLSIPNDPSSPLPHTHTPSRRRPTAEYTPSTLLANMLTLPDNVTTYSLPSSSTSCGCLPASWFSKGNAVHVIDEPLHESSLSPRAPPSHISPSSTSPPLSQGGEAPARRSYSYLPQWMRWNWQRHPHSRAGSYHYSIAALRSSVSPDIVTSNPNSGVEI